MNRVFFCPTCSRLEPGGGECSCGAGPFLDLRQRASRDLLESMESRRKHHHEVVRRWASVPFAAAALIALAVFFPKMGGELTLGLGVGAGLVFMGLLAVIFPLRSKLALLQRIQEDPNSYE